MNWYWIDIELWANPPDALAKYDLLTYCTCRNHLYLGPFEISTQEGLTAKLKEDGGFFAHEKVWLLKECLMVGLKAATMPILKHIETNISDFQAVSEHLFQKVHKIQFPPKLFSALVQESGNISMQELVKWCFQFGLSSTSGYHGNDQQDPRGWLQDSPWAGGWNPVVIGDEFFRDRLIDRW